MTNLAQEAPPTYEHPTDAYEGMRDAYGDRPVDTALRALDLLIAGGTLLIASPLLAAVAAAIRVADGPPVFYRGQRVGRGGQIFVMYKLRTLKPGAEVRLGNVLGDKLTALHEHEVTKLGRVLRAVHIDELPQLWNVVRGDMSMVGPRPIRPAFFAELTAEIPQYWQRLVVRPGVTGFAQTRVRREETWGDKLAHDLEYIADRSVTLYFQVLGATALRIVRQMWEGLVHRGRPAAR